MYKGVYIMYPPPPPLITQGLVVLGRVVQKKPDPVDGSGLT
jgi:hypothetical protein